MFLAAVKTTIIAIQIRLLAARHTECAVILRHTVLQRTRAVNSSGSTITCIRYCLGIFGFLFIGSFVKTQAAVIRTAETVGRICFFLDHLISSSFAIRGQINFSSAAGRFLPRLVHTHYRRSIFGNSLRRSQSSAIFAAADRQALFIFGHGRFFSCIDLIDCFKTLIGINCCVIAIECVYSSTVNQRVFAACIAQSTVVDRAVILCGSLINRFLYSSKIFFFIT